MIIKKLDEVRIATLEGYDRITKQIVIGPDDGSNEIVLRYFSIEPGGASPHHTHNFPHLVKIETGSGIVTDSHGTEHQLREGDFVYINDNEDHQFTNTGTQPFGFVCIVPRRGEA